MNEFSKIFAFFREILNKKVKVPSHKLANYGVKLMTQKTTPKGEKHKSSHS